MPVTIDEVTAEVEPPPRAEAAPEASPAPLDEATALRRLRRLTQRLERRAARVRAD